jgi:peptidoglycan hydrolase CwlO-like protein
MKRRFFVMIAVCGLVFASTANAQNETSSSAPVSYTSVSQLNTLLGQLQQATQSIQTTLGKMRVDKWKTDNNNKRQAEANVESIQRNLQSALPEIVTQLRSAPEDMRATFKLYRNLDALYDVMVSVTELAGAFGSKDDFQSLSNDISSIENTRRGLADRMDSLTGSKEAEMERLRNQVRALQASIPATPPKKTVVDDTEPPKKPSKKKIPKPPTASQAQPPK